MENCQRKLAMTGSTNKTSISGLTNLIEVFFYFLFLFLFLFFIFSYRLEKVESDKTTLLQTLQMKDRHIEELEKR